MRSQKSIWLPVLTTATLVAISAVCRLIGMGHTHPSEQAPLCSFSAPKTNDRLFTTVATELLFQSSFTNLIEESAFVFAFAEILEFKDKAARIIDEENATRRVGGSDHTSYTDWRRMTECMWEILTNRMPVASSQFVEELSNVNCDAADSAEELRIRQRLSEWIATKLEIIRETSIFPESIEDSKMEIRRTDGLRRFILFQCSQLSNEQANLLAWFYFKLLDNVPGNSGTANRIRQAERGIFSFQRGEKANDTAFSLHEIYDAAFERNLSEYIFIASFLAVNQWFWKADLKELHENDEMTLYDPADLVPRRKTIDLGKVLSECQEDVDNEFAEMISFLSLEFDKLGEDEQDAAKNALLVKIDSFVNESIDMALQRRAYPETRMERYDFIHTMCSYVDNWQAKTIVELYHANMKPFKDKRSNEIEDWEIFIDVISRKSGLK